ncbi:MAG: hypothetical protein ACOX6L_06310 [Syntrophomonadaceae bacterium]|jgi:hypothetical protein
MFFTYLNKEEPKFLDQSVMLAANPGEVLYYFYNRPLYITLNDFYAIELESGSGSEQADYAQSWLSLIETQLQAIESLISFSQNEFLLTLGPYYYPITNSRFYFVKNRPDESSMFTATDLSILKELAISPPINNSLQQYAKTRKARKALKTRDEIINDIKMCMQSLKEIEQLNRHTNYLRKVLLKRQNLIGEADLCPEEPDNLPVKPTKSQTVTSIADNIISFSRVNRWKNRAALDEGSRFNHEMKVYIIRYREYEKACERYKMALEEWSLTSQAILDNCLNEINKVEDLLKTARGKEGHYLAILKSSPIHNDYQNPETLGMFRYFLETGRASDIQECMNLFEEEKHWNEIKAGQERIENTIYFLQNCSESGRLAGEELENILKRQQEINYAHPEVIFESAQQPELSTVAR